MNIFLFSTRLAETDLASRADGALRENDEISIKLQMLFLWSGDRLKIRTPSSIVHSYDWDQAVFQKSSSLHLALVPGFVPNTGISYFNFSMALTF